MQIKFINISSSKLIIAHTRYQVSVDIFMSIGTKLK